MNIRPAFAQVVGEKIARPGAGPVNGNSLVPMLEQASHHISTRAGDEVEVNFEPVAKAIASKNIPDALALNQKAPEAVKTFGDQLISGFGSSDNHSYQSYGDGIFSIQGGNSAQPDVTFMIDTTPGQDGMQWLVLDNSKLPKPVEQAAGQPSAPVADYQPMGSATDNPNVLPYFSERMTKEFGDQSLSSITSERISSISGYFLEDWESPGMVNDIALGQLGDQWAATKNPNEFKIKSDSASQTLTFDPARKTIRLESFFKNSDMDCDMHSQTLTKDATGALTSYIPPT